ncbi:unnamed protein product [Victoria cruziana]
MDEPFPNVEEEEILLPRTSFLEEILLQSSWMPSTHKERKISAEQIMKPQKAALVLMSHPLVFLGKKDSNRTNHEATEIMDFLSDKIWRKIKCRQPSPDQCRQPSPDQCKFFSEHETPFQECH